MSELAYLFCGKSNSTLLTLLLVTAIGVIGNFQWNLRKYAQLESAIVIMLIAIGLAQNENYSRVEAKRRN